MQLDDLQTMIRAAGGGDNALEYAEALCEKVNRIELLGRYASLLKQLRAARDQGDFRGRVLEVNFVDCFARKGIALDYGIKQGKVGDIDFGWKIANHTVNIELKLLGESKAVTDEMTAQLERSSVATQVLDGDTRDIARLQTNIFQKASTRKFNSNPETGVVNIVAIDASELQLGMADICDCLLAARGRAFVSRHYGPDRVSDMHEGVVGIFENISTEKLRESQRSWLAGVQTLDVGVPHPRSYLHGVLFLFRDPAETAALSYELRGALAWNPGLMTRGDAKTIADEFQGVSEFLCMRRFETFPHGDRRVRF